MNIIRLSGTSPVWKEDGSYSVAPEVLAASIFTASNFPDRSEVRISTTSSDPRSAAQLLSDKYGFGQHEVVYTSEGSPAGESFSSTAPFDILFEFENGVVLFAKEQADADGQYDYFFPD